jgi:hypothetical protein
MTALERTSSIWKRQTHLSSEKMLHKDYERKCSVEESIIGRESQGPCHQGEMIGGKSSVVK